MMSSEDIMTIDLKYQIDCSNGANAASDFDRLDSVSQTLDLPTHGDFLDQTIAVWQPYADRSLTLEDAREIAHNVVGFFRVLREWAEEERRSAESMESSSPQLGGADSNLRPQKA